MSEKYDLIFSLGSVPLTAELLKDEGMQIFDFPFDKIMGADFYTRMNMFLSGFRDFIDQKDLKEEKDMPAKGITQYKDMRTNFVYLYDFNPEIPIENNFPSVKERYDKYIRYLKLHLAKAKKILIVYIENPTIKENDDETSALIAQSIEKLKEKYPKKEFHIIYAKNEEDLENTKIIQIGSHAEKMIFNFYRKFSDTTSYFVDVESLKIILTDIELKKTWRQKKIIFYQKLLKKVLNWRSQHSI